jgi:hypothetical protein
MSTKHTPGPWKDDSGVIVTDYVDVRSNRRSGTAAIAELVEGYTIDEREANAALIASAPDMSLVLRAILQLRTVELSPDGQRLIFTAASSRFYMHAFAVRFDDHGVMHIGPGTRAALLAELERANG